VNISTLIIYTTRSYPLFPYIVYMLKSSYKSIPFPKRHRVARFFMLQDMRRITSKRTVCYQIAFLTTLDIVWMRWYLSHAV